MGVGRSLAGSPERLTAGSVCVCVCVCVCVSVKSPEALGILHRVQLAAGRLGSEPE